MRHESNAGERRAQVLLAVGALIGMSVAVAGLSWRALERDVLPHGVVARVNASFISDEVLERRIAALDREPRGPVTPELRSRVLDQMIEQELLVQRALELGLAERDDHVRADLSNAVIRSVVLEAQAIEPTESELVAFYRAESAFFARAGRVRVGAIFVRSGDAGADAALRRAETARHRLSRGEAFEEVERTLGDAAAVRLPDVLLPPSKLREYVGTGGLQAILALDEGAVSDPLEVAGGYHVFVVRERSAGYVPAFGEVRDQVRAEFIRRAGDAVLSAYVRSLRRSADVVVRGDVD